MASADDVDWLPLLSVLPLVISLFLFRFRVISQKYKTEKFQILF